MPLVSALAASHAPNILMEPGAEWEDFMKLHYRMAPQAAGSKPSLEVQQKLRRDAEKAFEVLRKDLQASRLSFCCPPQEVGFTLNQFFSQ